MPGSHTLERFAAHQPRPVPKYPHGMAHEQTFGCRQTIDEGEAHIAHQTRGTKVVGEQPVEPVGYKTKRAVVEASPALVGA